MCHKISGKGILALRSHYSSPLIKLAVPHCFAPRVYQHKNFIELVVKSGMDLDFS
jgi:hypothetical protein